MGWQDHTEPELCETVQLDPEHDPLQIFSVIGDRLRIQNTHIDTYPLWTVRWWRQPLDPAFRSAHGLDVDSVIFLHPPGHRIYAVGVTPACQDCWSDLLSRSHPEYRRRNQGLWRNLCGYLSLFAFLVGVVYCVQQWIHSPTEWSSAAMWLGWLSIIGIGYSGLEMLSAWQRLADSTAIAFGIPLLVVMRHLFFGADDRGLVGIIAGAAVIFGLLLVFHPCRLYLPRFLRRVLMR